MPKVKGLTVKQKRFCEEYILDWNASRAALAAGYSEKTAPFIGAENLKKPQIKEYLEHVQDELERIAGVSRLKILKEHMKMAFSSIAHLHNTWIERKDFEALTDEQRDCIAEISTQTRKITKKIGDEEIPVETEFVKIKLYDKQKALEAIQKMLGYDAPQKVEADVNHTFLDFLMGTDAEN